MSKRGYLWRYGKIVQKVQQKPYITKSELLQSLEKEMEQARFLDDEMEAGISARTLERDLREIRNLVGISIEYSRSMRGYYIERDNVFGETTLMRMMDSFEMFRSLNVAQELQNVVYPEKERPQGMEQMYGLIHAIKNRLRIRFVYTKFWDEKPGKRAGKPYALKEFNRRWYLLLHDEGDNRLKVFGLDRMSNLEITSERFPAAPQPDVEAIFAPCFGITIPAGAEPQEVILAFAPLQAKYVKSLPLHPTQKIVSETADELRISIKVYLTFELEKQILSYGEEAKVIQPQILADTITERLKRTLGKYE
jgi:predicted DNA-binding transcriptional regulator YafY